MNSHSQILDTIQGLGKLLKEGILTSEEFQKQKEVLLSKLADSHEIKEQVSTANANKVSAIKKYSSQEVYSLYSEAYSYFTKESMELSAVFENLEKENKKLSDYLVATRPYELKQRLENSAENFLKFLCSKLQISLDKNQYGNLRNTCFQHLHIAISAIDEIDFAKRELMERKIPDTKLGQYAQGVAMGYLDPKCVAAQSTGAAIGTFILPGIGTTVGAMLGSLLVGKEIENKDQQALEKFFSSLAHFGDAVELIYPKIFDSFSEALSSYFTFEISGERLHHNLKRFQEIRASVLKSFEEENANFDTCLLLTEEGIKLLPYDAYVHWLHCLALEKVGKLDEALLEAKLAVQLDPSQSCYWISYLSFLRQKGQNSQALECIPSLLQQFPEDNGIHKIALEIFHQIGNIQEASKHVDYLLTSDPNNTEFLHYAFHISAQKGDIETSLRYFKKEYDLVLFSPISLKEIKAHPPLKHLVDHPQLSHIFPKNFSQALIHLKNKQDNFYWGNNIPDEKFLKASSSFLFLVKSENILCYKDTTAFGGGEDGFAFTDKSIVWKNLWENPVRICYSDIRQMTLNAEKITINSQTYVFPDPEFAKGAFRFITVAQAFLLVPTDNMVIDPTSNEESLLENKTPQEKAQVHFQKSLQAFFHQMNQVLAWQEICKACELDPDPTYVALKATMLWHGQGVLRDEKLANDIAYPIFSKLILKEDSFSWMLVGICYSKGLGTENNLSEAFQWYKKSADAGSPYGMLRLGYCYDDGEGVEKDERQCFQWVKKAAETGDSFGMMMLGASYDAGKGVTQDFQQAFEWFKKAAESGNALGMCGLVACYYEGKGITQDFHKAFRWAKKAAQAGNPSGMYWLGRCYYEGKGVAQDTSQAYQLLNDAANAGEEEARVLLQQIQSQQSGCFIATAVYGDYNHPQVLILRRFRDQKLSKSMLGKALIQFYYFLGPKLAWFVHKNKSFHGICLYLLDKFVASLDKKITS